MKESSEDTISGELRGIKGIGPARQKWLQETLNIMTIDDLAMAAWESIEFEVSQDDDIIIPRREIQNWITQARSQQATMSQPNSAPQSLEEIEEIEKIEEIELNDPIELIPSPIVPPSLSVQITQIKIIQSDLIQHSIVPGQSTVPILWRHQPFAIDVQFEIETAVETAIDSALQDSIAAATYHLQCHAQNRITRQISILESPFSSPLIPDQTSYDSRLPNFQLDIGIYRLQIWVTLQGLRSVGYFDIPLIQIT